MAMAMRLALADLPAGFRFHPTDEELVVNYLQRRAAGQPCPVPIVADVDIYKFDPWELPSKASFGDREWYFFTPRDRKYPNGVRPNRSAASGFWKATGTDKVIQAVVQAGHDGGSVQAPIGVKKALVFYVGRAPRGTKTPWIMHEYRLTDVAAQAAAAGRSYSRSSAVGSAPSMASSSSSSMRLDEWVLCRIFSKTGPPSPGPDSDSPPADIPLLEDLLAPPDNLINVMHRPPPAANIMYAPPASVIQNNSSSDYYYTDDSNTYSGMLLAIQEETADDQLVGEEEDATYSIPILYHCHCQQNNYNGDEAIFPEPEPDQLEEAMANDTGATDHANFDHQEGDASHNNAAMDSSSSSFSDQQIDSLLMDLAFFGNQHQQCSS